MTTDLPDELKDRAARAACVALYGGWCQDEAEEWHAVVDAVLAVVGSYEPFAYTEDFQPTRTLSPEEIEMMDAHDAAHADDADRGPTYADVVAERDELRAAVRELLDVRDKTIPFTRTRCEQAAWDRLTQLVTPDIDLEHPDRSRRLAFDESMVEIKRRYGGAIEQLRDTPDTEEQS